MRFLFSRPTSLTDVLFVFRLDNIAQEENETLTFELRLLPWIVIPTGRNVFFKRTIKLTIIDIDGKRSVCLVGVLQTVMFLLKQR